MPKPIFKKNNLNKIVFRAINLHELSESRIKFIYPSNKKPAHINCDQEQINRVLINLLKNSIESINEKNKKTLILLEKLTWILKKIVTIYTLKLKIME